ncbi:hypothetical protein T05_5115 [Trichinella murrelli]|uniref:SAP domain-containing protein n=1 Tax=Trichinella murrelli TaxID=144512 RepID=A0A0V0TZ89_9BILA|nr:hypothetical protein T05_5115 [Trichinella murrelli]
MPFKKPEIQSLDSIHSMRVVDLREALRARNLSASGNKAALCERLHKILYCELRIFCCRLFNFALNSRYMNCLRLIFIAEIVSLAMQDDDANAKASPAVPHEEAPNSGMQSCGSKLVAKYLEEQKVALMKARKAAVIVALALLTAYLSSWIKWWKSNQALTKNIRWQIKTTCYI